MSDDIIQAITALVDRLSELDRERGQIEAQLTQIREAVGATASDRRRQAKANRPTRKRAIRQNSSLWFAHKVIENRGVMHIDQLVDAVAIVSGKRIERASLVSALSRDIRSASATFIRPKEGYYGLAGRDEQIIPSYELPQADDPDGQT